MHSFCVSTLRTRLHCELGNSEAAQRIREIIGTGDQYRWQGKFLRIMKRNFRKAVIRLLAASQLKVTSRSDHTFAEEAFGSARELLNQLDDDTLRRLEAFRVNLKYRTEIIDELSEVGVEAFPEHLARIERLTNAVIRALTSYTPNSPNGVYSYQESSEPEYLGRAIITGITNFLPVPAGTIITPVQEEALVITTARLAGSRVIEPEKDVHEGSFLIDDVGDMVTLNEEITRQIVSDHRDLDSVVASALHRVRIGIAIQRATVREEMFKFSDETIDGLAAIHNADDFGFRIIMAMIEKNADESMVREALHFMPYVSSMNQLWNVDDGVVPLMLRSLHAYPGLPECADFSVETEAVRDQCAALLVVSNAILTHTSKDDSNISVARRGNTVQIIADDRLVRLILDSPDLAEDIASLIETRGTADFGLIENVLTAPSAALREGAL